MAKLWKLHGVLCVREFLKLDFITFSSECDEEKRFHQYSDGCDDGVLKTSYKILFLSLKRFLSLSLKRRHLVDR